jgi:hypothetical protein
VEEEDEEEEEVAFDLRTNESRAPRIEKYLRGGSEI